MVAATLLCRAESNTHTACKHLMIAMLPRDGCAQSSSTVKSKILRAPF
jgi:hypothetical protein